MNIVQVGNPDGIEFISHLIMEDGDYSSEQLVDYFKEMLIKEPSKCCFLLAVKNESPVAFLLSYADDTTNHVFIQQAWSDPSVPPSIVDNMFYRLVTWSHTIGRNSIKIETTRSPKVFERRWNMKLLRHVMEFIIPEDYEKKFHELHDAVIGKGNNNGRQHIIEIHSIGETKSSVESSGEVSGASIGGGGGEVSRGESSPINPRTPTTEGRGRAILAGGTERSPGTSSDTKNAVGGVIVPIRP